MKKSKLSPVEEPASAPLQHKPSPSQRMLVYASRRLLTEKSPVAVHSFLLGKQTETLTIRATMATVLTEEIQDHSHCGLND